MPNSLENYTFTAADWRRQIRINNRRTAVVIGLFLVIYTAIGLIVDLYLQLGHYPRATIPQLLTAFASLQITPYATLVMIGIAVLSLLVVLTMHDQLMLLGTEYREITPATAMQLPEQQLYHVIEELKIAASLRYMPRVYLIEADYMNAFASGYSEKSAMVAITRGLLEKLTRAELQAVMAHEISHIRHQDIKLTLIASVLANLMTIVIDMLFFNMLFGSHQDENERDRGRNQLAFIIIILRYLLPLINIILLLYLSRTREYLADSGCVELMRDNQPLATALLKIQQDYIDNQMHYPKTPHEDIRREAYIFDPAQAGFSAMQSLAGLFSTHPSIEERLAALGIKRKA